MAIGERIHFFRNQRRMTQKFLGTQIGFPEKSADVRLAQYESGTRTPKADITAALAQALDVAPQALTVPDIDSQIGLMHTLFALEDIYGVTIDKINGEICLRICEDAGNAAIDLLKMLAAWQEQSAKLAAGEITKEDYDKWRYHYPKYNAAQTWMDVSSNNQNNTMLKTSKDKIKE